MGGVFKFDDTGGNYCSHIPGDLFSCRICICNLSKQRKRYFIYGTDSFHDGTFCSKIIPMFRMFSEMKLLNSYWAIILPAIGAPFLIFFFKQNTHAFPQETIQAARVDGLNELQIFIRIFMPMMKSTYAAAGIFSFMASWNNYMWPLIALQSNSKFTLPLTVSNLAAGFTPDYGMVMVGIIISTVPTILVFFLLQNAFVEGMVGSVK